MQDANNFIFEIRDCRLSSLNFEINREFVPGPDVEIETNIVLEHGILEDQNLLRLFVRLSASGDKSPMSISVEMGSLFFFPNGLENNPELQQIAEINCASIVYPFIRELIADVTRRAGLSPLLLPPVNFIEMYKTNHPSIE